MRKSFKKLIVVLFSLLLACSAFALTACGKDDTATVEPEITLNAETIELMAGKSFNLIATVETDAEDKTVTWSSDDTSVATVSTTGRVKAVGKGVAIITATADNGDLEAYCGVTVNLEEDILTEINQDQHELWDFFDLPYAEVEFNSTGKLVVKNATIVNDYRAYYRAFLTPTLPALPEALWDSIALVPILGIPAVERIPALYDIETEFYWQDDKFIIEDAVAVVAENLKDEYGNEVKGADGVTLKCEVEKSISFKAMLGTGDASGTISIESSVGGFVLDAMDATITKAIERPSELGDLLVELASDENKPEDGNLNFYSSGKLVVSNMTVQFPMDDFTVEYTYQNGELSISNGATDAAVPGLGAFGQVVKFDIAAGDAGAKVITVKFHNGGSDTDVRISATFTITAEQLALLG